MFFTKVFVTLVAAASAVSAIPMPLLAPRGCNVPPPNKDVAKRIVKVALDRGNSPMGLVMVAMMDTAIQESNVNNLDCGDKDSVGVFQQRYTQGWGTIKQIMNVEYSTGKYLDVAEPIAKSNPGMAPHTLAQKVQNAEAGDLYSHDDEAKSLIKEALASLGVSSSGSGAANVAPKPKPATTKTSSPKTTKSAAAAPKPTTGSGAANVAPKPAAPAAAPAAPATDDGESSLIDGCKQVYVPVAGDNCYKVSNAHGLTLAAFYDMNPCLDDVCSNLYKGEQYCVAM